MWLIFWGLRWNLNASDLLWAWYASKYSFFLKFVSYAGCTITNSIFVKSPQFNFSFQRLIRLKRFRRKLYWLNSLLLCNLWRHFSPSVTLKDKRCSFVSQFSHASSGIDFFIAPRAKFRFAFVLISYISVFIYRDNERGLISFLEIIRLEMQSEVFPAYQNGKISDQVF